MLFDNYPDHLGSTSVVTDESEPTLLNALAFGVDTVLTAAPYAPAVGGIAIRGAGRFFSKADDIGRAAKIADRGGDIGRASSQRRGVCACGAEGGEEFIFKIWIRHRKAPLI